jgi:hypothetical protein
MATTAATSLVALGSLGAGALVAPSAASAAATGKSVAGVWHVTTTDCVYGCQFTTARLTEEPDGLLRGPPGSGYGGSIAGRVMTIAVGSTNPPEIWSCSGNLNKKYTAFRRGRFTAVVGTTVTYGNCAIKKVG